MASEHVVPELSAALAEKLRSNQCECVVCTEAVGRRDRLWSCRLCFGIFHLPCIVYWANTQYEQQRAEAQRKQFSGSVGELFRCPLCQGSNPAASTGRYLCFCGHTEDPAVDPSLLPGSCGQPCSKRRADVCCSHPCSLPCHPGPCPACAFVRMQACYCGASEKSVGCSSGSCGYECGEVCGKELGCGRHYCERRCHEGPCLPCTAEAAQQCFCGASSRVADCSRDSRYACGGVCRKKRDCGEHECGNRCHDGQCNVCLRLPARVHTCPCGKVSLWKMHFENPQLTSRETCAAPIPTCGQRCGLPLPCGHECEGLCHDTAACPPCCRIEPFACRCGVSTRQLPCFTQYLPQPEWADAAKAAKINERLLPEQFPPLCQRKCNRKKTCGRHACETVCCDNTEEHVCMQVCRKKAPCGVHECGQLCHRGPCPPCLNSSFDRLFCRCRRTFIEPPVPCGTLPPNCNHPCVVPRPCGHPANHPCHFAGDCPPCVVSIPKRCGSHDTPFMYPVPCSSMAPSCGKRCAKALTCCGAACEKMCHPGACQHDCKQLFPDLGGAGGAKKSGGGVLWGPRKK
jgi:transcriptional repressor NF-X1